MKKKNQKKSKANPKVVKFDRRRLIEIRLQELADKHGKLTPEMVVEDAKDKDSPLHGEFEWDVNKAALAHWIEKAREIIRSVKVVFRTEKKSYQSVAYVRDPRAERRDQGYISVDSVRSDEDLKREVLKQELDRAASILTRARDLAAVFGIEPEIDVLLDKLNFINSGILFSKKMAS
jgi:hypothetical protein